MFHFQSRNLTRKRGRDICEVRENERSEDWEEIKEQPRSHFKCKMQSRQCEYMIPSARRRCKLRTRRAWPYCWQHAQLVDHVIIRKSRIPGAGMGLFACDRSRLKDDIVFKKGDRITIYARKGRAGVTALGEFMTDDALSDRYGECVTSPYGVDTARKNLSVDTACQRTIASYANNANSHVQANAKMVWAKRNTELWLEAKKIIRNGDEIMWYYGDTYRYDYPEFFEHRVWHTGRKNTNAKCRHRKRSRSRSRSRGRRSGRRRSRRTSRR